MKTYLACGLLGSVAVVASIAGGCGGGGNISFASGVGGGATGGSTPGATTNTSTGRSVSSGTSTSTASTGTSTSAVASTSASTGTGGTTTATSTSSSTSSSSSGATCPPAPGDTACITCTKSMCCSDVVACEGDSNCLCWATCTGQHPTDPQVCLGMCGNPDGTTAALAGCTTGNGPCAGACGASSTTTTSSSSTGASSSSASSSSSGGTTACDPATGDSACTACTKMKCCSDVEACATDTDCACIAACVQANGVGQSFQCQQKCGGGNDQAWNTLSNCAVQTCGMECL